jgi:pyruvate dehydrogenase E1 component alpha subunit
MIEALSYRLGDHTTADDATRYRDPELVAQAWLAEPIVRLRKYLLSRGRWDKTREDELNQDCQRQVEAAVQAYLSVTPPDVGAMFDHLYASLPHAMTEQLETAQHFANDNNSAERGHA